ncbi:hypothetical protein DIPPA_08303 [Diplonema papillatum]|nr:hypothetical protein DIPPA_08303 [Diplonema papillatum]
MDNDGAESDDPLKVMRQQRVPMIDSGANINTLKLTNAQVAAMLVRAKLAGVDAVLLLGITFETTTSCLRLATSQWAADTGVAVYFTAGLHPCFAKFWSDDTASFLTNALSHERCVAVGECGIDTFVAPSEAQPGSPVDVQAWVFRRQLQLARHVGLPVVVHERGPGAQDVVLACLREEGFPAARTVVHCVTRASVGALAVYLRGGHYVSFSGAVCQPEKGLPLREMLREVARHPDLSGLLADRLLVETDAPFFGLAHAIDGSAPWSKHPQTPADPDPEAAEGGTAGTFEDVLETVARLKKSEPAGLPCTLAALAACLGTPYPALARRVHANTVRFFALQDRCVYRPPEGSQSHKQAESSQGRPAEGGARGAGVNSGAAPPGEGRRAGGRRDRQPPPAATGGPGKARGHGDPPKHSAPGESASNRPVPSSDSGDLQAAESTCPRKVRLHNTLKHTAVPESAPKGGRTSTAGASSATEEEQDSGNPERATVRDIAPSAAEGVLGSRNSELSPERTTARKTTSSAAEDAPDSGNPEFSPGRASDGRAALSCPAGGGTPAATGASAAPGGEQVKSELSPEPAPAPKAASSLAAEDAHDSGNPEVSPVRASNERAALSCRTGGRAPAATGASAAPDGEQDESESSPERASDGGTAVSRPMGGRTPPELPRDAACRGEGVAAGGVVKPAAGRQGEVRFMLPGVLAKLCKKMRGIGLDAELSPHNRLADIVKRAEEDDRVLLVRHAKPLIQLLTGKPGHPLRWLRLDSDQFAQQIRQVLGHFAIQRTESDLQKRCTRCNGSQWLLQTRDAVRDEINESTYRTHDQFWRCALCNKVTWEGCMYQKTLEHFRDLANPDSARPADAGADAGGTSDNDSNNEAAGGAPPSGRKTPGARLAGKPSAAPGPAREAEADDAEDSCERKRGEVHVLIRHEQHGIVLMESRWRTEYVWVIPRCNVVEQLANHAPQQAFEIFGLQAPPDLAQPAPATEGIRQQRLNKKQKARELLQRLQATMNGARSVPGDDDGGDEGDASSSSPADAVGTARRAHFRLTPEAWKPLQIAAVQSFVAHEFGLDVHPDDVYPACDTATGDELEFGRRKYFFVTLRDSDSTPPGTDGARPPISGSATSAYFWLRSRAPWRFVASLPAASQIIKQYGPGSAGKGDVVGASALKYLRTAGTAALSQKMVAARVGAAKPASGKATARQEGAGAPAAASLRRTNAEKKRAPAVPAAPAAEKQQGEGPRAQQLGGGGQCEAQKTHKTPEGEDAEGQREHARAPCAEESSNSQGCETQEHETPGEDADVQQEHAHAPCTEKASTTRDDPQQDCDKEKQKTSEGAEVQQEDAHVPCTEKVSKTRAETQSDCEKQKHKTSDGAEELEHAHPSSMKHTTSESAEAQQEHAHPPSMKHKMPDIADLQQEHAHAEKASKARKPKPPAPPRTLQRSVLPFTVSELRDDQALAAGEYRSTVAAAFGKLSANGVRRATEDRALWEVRDAQRRCVPAIEAKASKKEPGRLPGEGHAVRLAFEEAVGGFFKTCYSEERVAFVAAQARTVQRTIAKALAAAGMICECQGRGDPRVCPHLARRGVAATPDDTAYHGLVRAVHVFGSSSSGTADPDQFDVDVCVRMHHATWRLPPRIDGPTMCGGAFRVHRSAAETPTPEHAVVGTETPPPVNGTPGVQGSAAESHKKGGVREEHEVHDPPSPARVAVGTEAPAITCGETPGVQGSAAETSGEGRIGRDESGAHDAPTPEHVVVGKETPPRVNGTPGVQGSAAETSGEGRIGRDESGAHDAPTPEHVVAGKETPPRVNGTPGVQGSAAESPGEGGVCEEYGVHDAPTPELVGKEKRLLLCLLARLEGEAGFDDLQAVLPARVPVVKARLRGVPVDVTTRFLGCVNTRLFREYFAASAELAQASVLAKRWSTWAGVRTGEIGFFSAYTVQLLVIHALVRRGHVRHIPLGRPYLESVAGSPPGENVGEIPETYGGPPAALRPREGRGGVAPRVFELFECFLRFFGWEFDWRREVVCVAVGGPVFKEQVGWTDAAAAVRDPFEAELNLTRKTAAKRLDDIRRRFRLSHAALLDGTLAKIYR